MDVTNETATLRFYPDYLPAFPFEPTRERFHIGYENDHLGEGVRALVPFSCGEIVFACTGFVSSEVTQFSLQLSPGLHLHDPYFYGKILHSCDPNTHVDVVTRQFKAVHPIQPGDFVTMDYAQTEDYLFRNFPCACGAVNCRREVLGRKQLPSLEIAALKTPQAERLTDLIYGPTDLFDVLSDAKRRQILELLLSCNASLANLMQNLELSYRAVSTHIRILRQAGLVRQYKTGRQVFYAPDTQAIAKLLEEGRNDVERWLLMLASAATPPVHGELVVTAKYQRK